MCRRSNISIICKNCKKEFPANPSMIKAGRVCCSYLCSRTYSWSQPEYRKHMSLAHKGGNAKSIATLIAFVKSEKGKKILGATRLGVKNYGWKGEKAVHFIKGYYGLHSWIIRKMGRPIYCEQCKRCDRKKYEWANISHKYKKDLNDWARLCSSCHKLYDINKLTLNLCAQ